MTLLYRKKKETDKEYNSSEIDVFSPSFLKGFCIKGEKISIKTYLVRIYFWAITKGKIKIYYVKSTDGAIIHTSYVIPRCIKFPFLSENDFQIGPCTTHPDFRGRGIYPRVINHIVKTVGESDTVFSMTVDISNTPSIKGIEKAGFEKCGDVEKKGILKNYRIRNEKEMSK